MQDVWPGSSWMVAMEQDIVVAKKQRLFSDVYVRDEELDGERRYQCL